LIITSRCEALIIRAEGNTANRFSVTVPHDQVVHVRLEILDNAGLVCRNQVRTIVGKLESADSSVMRLGEAISALCFDSVMRTHLKNGLKIECKAIP
jgi:hypothetical protein